MENLHFNRVCEKMGTDDLLRLLEKDDAQLFQWGEEIHHLHNLRPRKNESFGIALFMVALKRYLRCGRQMYVVGPKHQQMFADTPCDGIPDVFFKLPHDCFYIALPEGDTGVDGVYVFHVSQGVFTFNIALKESIGGDDLQSISTHIDDLATFDVGDGVSILDIESAIELGLEEAGFSKDFDQYRAILRIAINTIVHLASGAETETDESALARRKAQESRVRRQFRGKGRPKDMVKLKRKLNSLVDTPIVTWIGKSVEDDPEIRIPQRGEKRGTWLARCGHRHHYWVGKRRISPTGKRIGEKLILKWVAPVYRFPENPDGRTREHRFIGDAANAACTCAC